MSQQELLTHVIQALDQAGIEYMITGSIVSSLQGEPRSTHDIDMVIAINRTQVMRLTEAFSSPDYYLDKNSIFDAIDKQDMFNMINISTGDKVDFWMLTGEGFDQSRFSRRCTEQFMGIKMSVSSPEDTILAKLRWARLSGGSEKQFTDALRVYEVQCEKLDMTYLERWAKTLEVEDLWQRLKGEAQEV
ncbi:hypothetical protein ACFL6Y_01855 [Elusimicrobiota bacterium]